MKFLIKIGLLLLCTLEAVQPSTAGTCAINKYNEDDIQDAVEKCTDITLNSISVPPNVTLTLNLKQGTKLTFQGIVTWEFFEWKGPLLNITGVDIEILGAPDHIIDVQGTLWWDTFGEHGGKIKPVFCVLHGLKNSVIHDLNVTNTPFYAISIEDSDGVVVYDVYIDNKEGDTKGGHNTDGFNVWRSNNVTFTRISVFNQDDCIAVKSGTNVLVTDTYCHGGHGLSIGSVGGRDYNIVENVTISNSRNENADNGIRIKTVYGATGLVRNITYKDIVLKDINNYGIFIDADYDLSTGEPTGVASDGVPIEHITLQNITGTVKKTGVNVYVIVKNATDWHCTGIDVTGGEQIKECVGIPEESGLSC
ncbi:hypothetical protein NQ315_014133 [Exocentrus adspersus]|uniref:endo-polygalacturonase n=1 Tax=Exocentrus adspersus TaxID=1586481 RepID=A0AAV8VVF8_9CUCU|nr:hypothetical protein NQ315_014133 [Exocentrus adspersus]